MVHTNAIGSAYYNFMKGFARTVQEHARKITDHEVSPVLEFNSAQERASFYRACADIAEDGWVPAFGMIDAAEQEREAIAKAFCGIPIRMCQYHLIEAVRKQFFKFFGRITSENQDAHIALQALRELQRCPSPDRFDEYYRQFRLTVQDLDRSPSLWRKVDDYLMNGWFSWRWRASCMDYGLPSQVTRDGPWSTNNYIESAFNVFDRIFLDCRANKR
jgi:hypothetical protein